MKADKRQKWRSVHGDLENNKRALERVMPKFLEQRLAAAGVKNVFVEMAADGERILGIERENRKWYLNSR